MLPFVFKCRSLCNFALKGIYIKKKKDKTTFPQKLECRVKCRQTDVLQNFENQYLNEKSNVLSKEHIKCQN